MQKNHNPPTMYTTQTEGFMFTVVTPKRVYRVRANGYKKVRDAFEKAGIDVLKILRDGDRA